MRHCFKKIGGAMTALVFVGSIGVSVAQAPQASTPTHKNANTPRSSSSTATGRSATPSSGPNSFSGASSWKAGQGSFSAASRKAGGIWDAGSTIGAAPGAGHGAAPSSASARSAGLLQATTPAFTTPGHIGSRDRAASNLTPFRHPVSGALGGLSIAKRSSGPRSNGRNSSPVPSIGRGTGRASAFGHKTATGSMSDLGAVPSSRMKPQSGVNSTSASRQGFPSRKVRKSLPGRQ